MPTREIDRVPVHSQDDPIDQRLKVGIDFHLIAGRPKRGDRGRVSILADLLVSAARNVRDLGHVIANDSRTLGSQSEAVLDEERPGRRIQHKTGLERHPNRTISRLSRSRRMSVGLVGP